MGLFSRNKAQKTQKAQKSEKAQEVEEIEGLDAHDSSDAEIPESDLEPAEAATPDESPESGGSAESADPEDDQDAQDARKGSDGTSSADEEASRGAHLEDGPYDVADAPEEDRIDLGGIQVPTIDGMELRMEVDQRTGTVTGANLVIGGSSLQVQAFAAPKSRGLWDEVRTSLRDSVVKQGGTAETRPGAFGTELITRLPVKRTDGRTGYRPARFIGIDGPRWFVRAILTGKALGDKEQSRRFETLVSRLVVVRGGEAMAPQELIPLNLPGQRPGVSQIAAAPLDPLARGPEITEVG
jgi:Protein of unknown function (DUF3710)